MLGNPIFVLVLSVTDSGFFNMSWNEIECCAFEYLQGENGVWSGSHTPSFAVLTGRNDAYFTVFFFHILDQHEAWKYMAKTMKNGYIKMIERICS